MLRLEPETTTPSEVLATSNLSFYTLPAMLLLSLNSCTWVLSAHFCRLRPLGNLEGPWKDPILPICILFLLALSQGWGFTLQQYLAPLWRAFLPYSPNQLHHTHSEILTPASWQHSPKVWVPVHRGLLWPPEPSTTDLVWVPTSGASSAKLLNSRPSLVSWFSQL